MADKKKGGLIKSFKEKAGKIVNPPVNLVKKHPRKFGLGAGMLIGIPGYETFLIAETLVGGIGGWFIGDRSNKGADWLKKKKRSKKKK